MWAHEFINARFGVSARSTLEDITQPVNNLAVDLDFGNWAKYELSGVATFQLLMDQIICMFIVVHGRCFVE